MFKLIVLLKRKPGTTMAEFRDHYERHHAVLVVDSSPLLRRYVRNYLTGIGNELYPADAEPPFDCITEAWFDSEDDFRRSADGILVPGKAAEIVADEERFLDRGATRWYTAVEEQTDLGATRR